jgi:hypothetical protein
MKRIAGFLSAVRLFVASLGGTGCLCCAGHSVRVGVWADEEGKSNIEIAPCGQFFAVESSGLQSQLMLTASKSVT